MYDDYGLSILEKLNIPSYLSLGLVMTSLRDILHERRLTLPEVIRYTRELTMSTERKFLKEAIDREPIQITLDQAVLLFRGETYTQLHEDRDPTHVEGWVGDLWEPEAAENQCFRVAKKFHDYLIQRNIPSKLIIARGYTPHSLATLPHEPVLSENFKSTDLSEYSHVVVVSDGKWIDWSARQLDAASDFPYIKPYVVEVRSWNTIGRLVEDTSICLTDLREDGGSVKGVDDRTSDILKSVKVFENVFQSDEDMESS